MLLHLSMWSCLNQLTFMKMFLPYWFLQKGATDWLKCKVGLPVTLESMQCHAVSYWPSHKRTVRGLLQIWPFNRVCQLQCNNVNSSKLSALPFNRACQLQRNNINCSKLSALSVASLCWSRESKAPTNQVLVWWTGAVDYSSAKMYLKCTGNICMYL